MLRNKIYAIIILMSFALIGVILVQIYWIDTALKIRHEQFVGKVNDAMNAVVTKLETQEAFEAITKQISPSGLDNDQDEDEKDKAFSGIIEPFFDGMMVPDIGINDSEINFSLRKNPLRIAQKRVDVSSNIVGEMSAKKKMMIHTINDSVQFYLKQSMNMMNSKMNQVSEVMQKMATEFLHSDDNIMQRIHPEVMENMIKSELANHNIHADFVYGIVNTSDHKVLLAQAPKNDKNLLKSNYKIQLFPNDIFVHPDKLVLYFPGSKTWVIRRLWGMLLLSIVFTLIIIFAFTYTIIIIFRQKKLSDIKTDFINNMTHEFKTPIATISLSVDSINNPKVFENKEKLHYFTNIIKEENNRMNLQVEQVLKMAMLDKGEYKLNFEEVDMHLVINNAVRNINLQVEQKNGLIAENLTAKNAIIEADSVHISNIIFNLLDNANKYSPDRPEIKVSTWNDDKGIYISVADKGIGMKKDAQKRIFEKFYRVPTGNLHDVKGFGLGLSYVKELVEAHQGTITVKSEPFKGSIFELFLPFKQ